ncbi:hypothetical protein ACHAW6_004009, partial [Cyclotella cf. meneghiniana]
MTTYPGQCASVDQFQSTQAGFVAQLKGKLTTRRYYYGTIFVDHFSRLRYVHFMTTQTSAKTLQAKQAFEKFAAERGVRIKHYHCDNGRFADNAFKQHAEQQQQTLTFCGVNAHFQNGIAERAIRDLTESARKQLLHAKARWPKCIHLALWPYAMRCALHVYNTAPILDDGTSRKTLPKWSPRARLGLNLGPSPNHARNVNLILNLDTGLVSPQFHCQYDDFFETTSLNKPDTMTSSNWQVLAGL